MTDILGAISASLDLAIFITKQVEKVKDAPETVQVIIDDVRRLTRILDQLGDTLRPDQRAGYAAVRLSSQGLQNGLDSVKRCETTLAKLGRTLEDIFGKEQWNHGEPLRFGKRARLNYAYHDGPVRRLLTELRECKWDIMLSNSVNQLYLAKQPSQLHPLDYEKLDYLQVLCELALAQKQSKQSTTSGSSSLPPSDATGADATDVFSPNAVHGPAGSKGLYTSALSQSPAVHPSLQTQSPAPSRVIRKVHRSLLDEKVLDQERIRWLNDPFDQQYINIHEPLDDRRLGELTEQSQSTHVEESSFRMKKGRSRGDSRPAAYRSEELEIAKKAMLEKAQQGHKAKIYGNNVQSQAPREDLVEDLMHQWILSPEEKPAMPANPSPTKCKRRFRQGELMYACPKCGYDDETVFCSDCFNWVDHQGHGAESVVANHDEAYCDCGHSHSIRRPVTCANHGSMVPENYG
ncbi:hypothetical protein PG989_001911 [Apiospora arundinis]|uniref:E3 ubiquitin-protein ligase n=1 Tax=Apiospora arundinis TaxID=335852 RepID=A0ABR2HM58_9PEZI